MRAIAAALLAAGPILLAAAKPATPNLDNVIAEVRRSLKPDFRNHVVQVGRGGLIGGKKDGPRSE